MGHDLVRIEGEAAGQFAVGVGLGEEVVGPSLERGDRVGAGSEPQRWLLLTGESADSDSAARLLFAECPHAILRLVQPHIMDLSTSNSAPGEDGSKPCSISQRAAARLRHDHQA